MSEGLRFLSLQAQNVLRLSAVELTWDKEQSLLIVGGRNGQGKSSVLNSVAMALGGAALCPDEPLKRGEAEGFVEVDLGEIVVRREFSREKIQPSAEDRNAGVEEWHWTETKSRIIVRNADGIRLGTPQAILDKMVGKLTFDPLAFAQMGEEGSEGVRRQAAILRKVVNLDTTDLDAKREAAFQRRADFNKRVKQGEAVLTAMARHEDAPKEEVSMQAIGDEMVKAEETRQKAEEAERAVAQKEKDFDAVSSARSTLVERNKTLHEKLAEVQRAIAEVDASIAQADQEAEQMTKELDALRITAQAARAVVPDVAALRQRLSDVEALNAKTRANKTYEDEFARVQALERQANDADAEVKRLDAEKSELLAAVKFPVEGLGIENDIVTFNGMPLKQASTAEQIKVSVAIGFALNPDLKLLIVRNGNALDEDSLKAVAEQAEAAGGQILMEYVTKDASQASVMIEDGHVA